MKQHVWTLPSSALPSTAGFVPFKALARVLSFGMLLLTAALIFTPWQQSVSGRGRVIAYAPLERRQAVEAPIAGRVVHWYVQEGDKVKQGEPLADLSDNDPEILRRLTRERDAAKSQLDSVTVSVSLMAAQVASLSAARDSALAAAAERVRIAAGKQRAADNAVAAAFATLKTAELNLKRQRELNARGLSSKRDYELAQLDAEQARTALERAKAHATAAAAEVKALKAAQAQVSSTQKASIESTRASLEKLKAERAKADAGLAKVEVRLARQQQMQVSAPRSGVIFRLVANQGTEMVKAGDPLVILVPEAESRAVELYVDGNDAPLVGIARDVRLQFEGWPALQFVGWPSVAVGTFPGKVALVDAHADDRGRFRIVIVPEEQSHWPDAKYLRQGVRANGWVLLNQVSLGFELWRQFNGFPPAVSTASSSPITGKTSTSPSPKVTLQGKQGTLG